MKTLERVFFDPNELGSETFRKKLVQVVREGHKAALANPNYGLGCKCKRCELDPNCDPSREPKKTYLMIGPRGGPYSDKANVYEAGHRANHEYGAEFDGHFDWGVDVDERDKGRYRQRAWLRIRFIPDRLPADQLLVSGRSTENHDQDIPSNLLTTARAGVSGGAEAS